MPVLCWDILRIALSTIYITTTSVFIDDDTQDIQRVIQKNTTYNYCRLYTTKKMHVQPNICK